MSIFIWEKLGYWDDLDGSVVFEGIVAIAENHDRAVEMVQDKIREYNNRNWNKGITNTLAIAENEMYSCHEYPISEEGSLCWKERVYFFPNFLDE